MNTQLQENNYIFIPKFIDTIRAKTLADDFRKFASSANAKGDHQVPESHSVYNYIPFFELLIEKIKHSTRLCGEELLPVCAYSRVYKNGNILARHKDRPGCEISITLNLDSDANWPIGIKNPQDEDVLVDLTPGDAMMYLGNIAEHWRDEFTGQDYVQVFLHYVNKNGPFNSEHQEFLKFVDNNRIII